jgi:signal transduction histidine kinase
MRKLDTIIWAIAARTGRVQLLGGVAPWEMGTPLDSWLSQSDMWAKEIPDPALVRLCDLIHRNADACEHRVLGATRDTVTLCSRIDPSAARDRLAFLTEVGAFLASSTDVATLATAAPRLAVPQLADWCTLRLARAVEGTTRFLVGHRDSMMEPMVREVEARRHGRDDARGALHGPGFTLAIEAGGAATGAAAEDDGADLRRRRAASELGLGSEMTVILNGRDARLGKLTFASARGARRFGIFDVLTAMEFGQRFSIALQHAAVVRRTRRAAIQREQLLATVSHDLRNPLAAILAGAHGLMRSVAEGSASPVSRRQIEAIRRSAERMNRLADDLLAIAELENGGIALRRQINSVGAILAEVGQLFEPMAAQRSQVLTVLAPSPDILVDCDSDRLLQVLSNLVGNALKFTPDSGRIQIKAWLAGGEVRFAVADDGPGIRARQLSRIFNAFWRAPPREHGGLGLGLAIAKELVCAHGGRIWAESPPGSGATFFFTLPLPIAGPGPEAANDSARPPAPRRTRTPATPLLYAPPGPDAKHGPDQPWSDLIG